MIIVRTPLRVSFFGGGTDHPTWFETSEPGAVLSTTINKYVYVQLRRLPAVFDFNYRIAWGILEEVKTLKEIQHPVVREVLEALRRHGRTGYEVIYNADLPSKTGLGSSSAFTVSFLHAFFGNQERLCSKASWRVRPFSSSSSSSRKPWAARTRSQRPRRPQPHRFLRRRRSSRQAAARPGRAPAELERSMMLFFTGFTRSADTIERRKIAKFPDRTAELRAIYEMVNEGERILLDNRARVADLGDLLHQAWMDEAQARRVRLQRDHRREIRGRAARPARLAASCWARAAAASC